MKIMLCQISNKVINPQTPDHMTAAEFMYESQWKAKKSYGYWKPDDFWELPLWIGEVTYALKAVEYFEPELYVIKSVNVPLLPEADAYCFSALEVNKEIIYTFALHNKDKPVYVGGYVDPKFFVGLQNVHWCDSVEALCERLAIPYWHGVDWSLFEGTKCIPRVTLSYGCAHRCKFCTVPHPVKTVEAKYIDQQIEAVKPLKFKLVYLNDKTFGQASNIWSLSGAYGIYDAIHRYNPEFEGFIVQTSVSTVLQRANSQPYGLSYWKRYGVKVIELGIETFNDDLLQRYRKPAREETINKAVKLLSEMGFKVVANIMLGLPGETVNTYYRTWDWLYTNYKHLFGVNIYTLALYKDSELGKEIPTKLGVDTDELAEDRTFWTSEERIAFNEMKDQFYGIGTEIWYKRAMDFPSSAQAAEK